MEGGPSMDGTPWVPIWVNSTEKVAFDFFILLFFLKERMFVF